MKDKILLMKKLSEKIIKKPSMKNDPEILKKRDSKVRANMLIERAVFYGYKPFNFKKTMLKTLKIAIAPICAIALVVILLATSFFGAMVTVGEENPKQQPFDLNDFNTISAKTKNEMVIGSADAEGSVYEIKDRVTLSGVDERSAYVKDKTNLTNIENVNGDEKLEMHDGYVYFENKKKDIVYEGIGKEKLPVSVKVSYFLDGKKLSPNEIKGKSGHVMIRFDYTNSTVNSDYIPYVAMSAVVLNTDNFTNIKTNANAMNCGANVLAYGGTIPGLQEFVSKNGHSSIKLNIDEYVQIEADTTSFSVDYTYTVFSSGYAKSIKEETLNSIENADGALSVLNIPTDKITTYISELVEGTEVFADAMQKLEEGSSELVDGSEKITAGSADLTNGALELSNGIRSLADGAKILADGSKDVVTGSGELLENSGYYQDGLQEYAEGVKTLNDGIKELNSKLTFMPGLSQIIKDIADLLSKLEEFINRISSYRISIQSARDNSFEIGDDETANQMDSLLTDLLPEGFFMTNVHSIIGHIADMLYEIADDIDELYNAAGKIEDGSEKLASSSDDLTKAYGELYSGMSSLDEGINLIDENLDNISEGSEDLAEGSDSMYQGTQEMNSAVSQLDTGINKLYESIKSINKEITQFKEKVLSIKDISIGGNAYTAGDNLRYLISKIRQLKETDSKYHTYSGADSGVDGTLTYVIKTDGIGN